MKRKKLVRVGRPSELSVADALITCAQTLIVISVLQRQTDPNEAYGEWMDHLHSILTSAEVLQTVVVQYAEELNLLKMELPPHIVLGGYRVEEINKMADKDDLPF